MPPAPISWRISWGPSLLPTASSMASLRRRLPGLRGLAWRRTAVVIIRVRRPMVFFRRILFQILQQPFDGFLELNVMTRSPGFWVKVDFYVGRDAMVFDVPFAFGRVEGEVRRGDGAAVDQIRITANADQAAPRAFAD